MGTIAQFVHFLAEEKQYKKNPTYYDSCRRPTAWARVITMRNIETYSVTSRRIQLFQSDKIRVIFGSFKKSRLNRASNFHSSEMHCTVDLWQQIKHQYVICRPGIAGV